MVPPAGVQMTHLKIHLDFLNQESCGGGRCEGEGVHTKVLSMTVIGIIRNRLCERLRIFSMKCLLREFHFLVN